MPELLGVFINNLPFWAGEVVQLILGWHHPWEEVDGASMKSIKLSSDLELMKADKSIKFSEQMKSSTRVKNDQEGKSMWHGST